MLANDLDEGSRMNQDRLLANTVKDMLELVLICFLLLLLNIQKEFPGREKRLFQLTVQFGSDNP